MSSIATKSGDAGSTGLAGGIRISKADLRVESYGTVDELNSFLGFARSLCSQQDIAAWTEQIQRTLFRVGADLATPPELRKPQPIVTTEDVDFLTNLVYQIEATEGILADWSLPGANRESAAYESHPGAPPMSSIATKTGDAGSTGLAGGIRISKADLRVESYGTVDELNSFLGFARSLCTHPDIAAWTEQIQRTLFRVGSDLATPPELRKPQPYVTTADVDFLTDLVYQIEATEGILADWSLPGANRESAAYEIARTVCRRAERLAVRFNEASAPDLPLVLPETLAYLNRLSDLIWLFGRLIEHRAGIDARLRTDDKAGPNFSRAW